MIKVVHLDFVELKGLVFAPHPGEHAIESVTTPSSIKKYKQKILKKNSAGKPKGNRNRLR